jgi:hypothetical protein
LISLSLRLAHAGAGCCFKTFRVLNSVLQMPVARTAAKNYRWGRTATLKVEFSRIGAKTALEVYSHLGGLLVMRSKE